MIETEISFLKIGNTWLSFLQAFVSKDFYTCHKYLVNLQIAAEKTEDPAVIYCHKQAAFILKNERA